MSTSPPRLFHFSDDPAIEQFVPRPPRVLSTRPSGMEWLNGPLVWAIDDWHQPMYLFPRDCPRILLWRRPDSARQDIDSHFGRAAARMLAYVEERWLDRIRDAQLYRYELAQATFESLHDAGMWVSRAPVRPLQMITMTGLPELLARSGVELRPLDVLTPLRDLWETSLHVSGIRLRNADGWTAGGGPAPSLSGDS